jgi:nitric oxide reductase NorD protein
MGMAHPPLDEDQRITWRPLFAAFAERMFRFQLLFDLCEDLRVNHRLHGLVPGFLSRLLRLARNHPTPEGAAGSTTARLWQRTSH